MNSLMHGDYEIFPAGQQLRNDDGSPGEWIALASIIRWRGEEVLALPVSWYPPTFSTQQKAAEHARDAAISMINANRCVI